jgi:hypothetical protein
MKNPYLNAVLAGLYIVCVVLVISTLVDKTPEGGDPLLVPIAMLSLFTLSAAVMGYLFVWQSVRMYLEGMKGEAVDFFLKTLATFALITVGFVIALYYSYFVN